MCEAMDWAHLPVSGGIYDQHPKLLDDWQVIWKHKAIVQKRTKNKTPEELARKAGKA